MAETLAPTGTGIGDAAQSLFSIPEVITEAFKNVSETIKKISAVDYAALGLVALGILIILLALGGVLVEEMVQKPGREFVESGTAEKIARLATKGG